MALREVSRKKPIPKNRIEAHIELIQVWGQTITTWMMWSYIIDWTNRNSKIIIWYRWGDIEKSEEN
jgi:hypothetical protein